MSLRSIDVQALKRLRDRQARAGAAPWLHAEVARRMAERLPVIRLQPETVIDWWAHAGASQAVLAQAYPKARVLRVETSAPAQESAPWWSVRHWRRGAPVIDASALPPNAGQLLWANMMLHAVPDPAALMQHWRRALAVDGFLMFSTLGPDTLAVLRALYRDAGWGSAHAAFTDMHDLGDMLVAAGFADPVMDQERLTLTWATPEALLQELRTLGANADPARFAGLRTPRWRSRLLDALRERATSDGRIGLEFELVYGHAFNPPPRAKLAGETRVPLEDLRSMARSGRRAGA
ncbi:MAG: methyltransferase domain-containing protein [Pseudomonadota bacterium]